MSCFRCFPCLGRWPGAGWAAKAWHTPITCRSSNHDGWHAFAALNVLIDGLGSDGQRKHGTLDPPTPQRKPLSLHRPAGVVALLRRATMAGVIQRRRVMAKGKKRVKGLPSERA